MKKYLIGFGAVALALLGAGCIDEAALKASSNTQTKTAALTEETQRRLMDAVPLPTLSTSAERKNIVRRLETWDDENKIGYVYLINYGKIMAFYTIKGKISSLNSYLTPSEQLVDWKGRPCAAWTASSSECYSVEMADLDGAYGSNDAGGIFFFTTEGAYVEWRGDYMFVDQPLKLTTPPELVREIK
jgi:hypothetical protein